jgi:hypothetical protein
LCPDPMLAYALVCMHPNGYVREAALKSLTNAAATLEQVLPVVILRSSDWVPQVRALAICSLDRLRQELPSEVFVRSLALMANENGAMGGRHSYARSLGSSLIDSLDDGALLALLKSSDVYARRRAAHAVVHRGRSALAFEAAVRQPDVVVARTVTDGLTPDEWRSEAILNAALNSRFSEVKAAAFLHLRSIDPGRAAAMAKSFLVSSSRGLRLLAQRYCFESAIDSATTYRDLLSSNTAIALSGLGEVGSPDDVTVVRPYLASPDGHLRSRAVTAIARLGGRGVEAEVASLLGDTTDGVTRSAAQALRRLGPVQTTIDTAWDFSEQLSHEGVRKATFQLFRVQRRWVLLRIACRSVTSTDIDLQERGLLLMGQCMREWNRSFTSPTNLDASELRETLQRAMATLRRDLADLVAISVRPHFGSDFL